MAVVVTENPGEGFVEELVEKMVEATAAALTAVPAEALAQLQSRRLELIHPWWLAEALVARPHSGLPLLQFLPLTSGQLSSWLRRSDPAGPDVACVLKTWALEFPSG